jgi:hypothetical protein
LRGAQNALALALRQLRERLKTTDQNRNERAVLKRAEQTYELSPLRLRRKRDGLAHLRHDALRICTGAEKVGVSAWRRLELW